MEHQVEALESGEKRCLLCLRTFAKEAWGECPGLPQHGWEPWPEGLETATRLKRKGLLPGPKRGAIFYPNAKDGSGWLWLYREEEATPKPPKSEKQLAALAKMQAAQRESRTCRLCRNLMPNKHALTDGYCRECDVIVWARKWLEAGFVVLDCETTGLGWGSEILQIGLVDQSGQVLLDTFVKPIDSIVEQEYETAEEEAFLPEEASDWRPERRRRTAFAVHGITNAMVADAPTFPELYPILQALLAGKRVMAYNADFDSEMLQFACEQHSLQKIEAQWSCVMESFAQWYGDLHRSGDYKWQSLGAACSHLKVTAIPTHDGAADALATLEVIRALAALQPQEVREENG